MRALLLTLLAASLGAQTLRVSPVNPHYLEWRGKARVLVTSAEHYGAVMNLDFDYAKYLATLEKDGLNYTRIFTGSYFEPQGAFGIERNTMAPARLLAPWARVEGKFDLDRIEPAYLERMKAFLAEASRRNIVVEITLFSSIYGAAQWKINPLNPENNINGLTCTDFRKLQTLDNGNALPVQERLVRTLARELNAFDNILWEIQNEPWSDNHTLGEILHPFWTNQGYPNRVEYTAPNSIAWQARMAAALREEEARFPVKHLVAQNVGNFRIALLPADLIPQADVLNFHYAFPESVTWNRAHAKPIGYDESGFMGADTAPYLRHAWNFLLSGGAVYNNLDYSFSVGKEDGTDVQPKSPGAGDPAFRARLKVLASFINSFDVARLQPWDFKLKGAMARCLANPGREYACYLEGRGPVEVPMPTGVRTAEWIDIDNGAVVGTSNASPAFNGAIALRMRAIDPGSRLRHGAARPE